MLSPLLLPRVPSLLPSDGPVRPHGQAARRARVENVQVGGGDQTNLVTW